MIRCTLFGASAILCLACGGSNLEAKAGSRALITDSPRLGPHESSHAPPLESVPIPITQLEREDVLKTVDAGLGRFLQKFEMEASLTESGAFSGFRIVRIHDEKAFQGLGIGPGDIVTSVNQRPIERPAEAYEAFVSLRSAERLDIDYLRGGRLMHLSLPIVGEPPSQLAKTQSKARDKGPSKKVAPAASQSAVTKRKK